jgi:hypothetical protein
MDIYDFQEAYCAAHKDPEPIGKVRKLIKTYGCNFAMWYIEETMCGRLVNAYDHVILEAISVHDLNGSDIERVFLLHAGILNAQQCADVFISLHEHSLYSYNMKILPYIKSLTLEECGQLLDVLLEKDLLMHVPYVLLRTRTMNMKRSLITELLKKTDNYDMVYGIVSTLTEHDIDCVIESGSALAIAIKCKWLRHRIIRDSVISRLHPALQEEVISRLHPELRDPVISRLHPALQEEVVKLL